MIEIHACRYCGKNCDGRHYADAGFLQLTPKINAADARGDEAEVERLQAECRALSPHAANVERSESSTPVTEPRRPISAASSRAVPEIAWRDQPEEVVILHADAIARISGEASDSRDGNERGGWLLLDTLGRDDTEFYAATGPGERARFAPDGVGLDLHHRVAIEESAQRLDSRLIVAGDFHTHMGQSVRPSEGDRTAWARNFEFLEKDLGARAAWTGIIATSEYDDDWRDPELHGFVVRRDPITRRLTCENATVKEID